MLSKGSNVSISLDVYSVLDTKYLNECFCVLNEKLSSTMPKVTIAPSAGIESSDSTPVSFLKNAFPSELMIISLTNSGLV